MRELDLRGVRTENYILEQPGRLLEKKGSCGGIHGDWRFWNQDARTVADGIEKQKNRFGVSGLAPSQKKDSCYSGNKAYFLWNPIVLLIREP